ncbi:TPA: hypothetical protein ACH5I5_005639, partial [Klebsiella variicola]
MMVLLEQTEGLAKMVGPVGQEPPAKTVVVGEMAGQVSMEVQAEMVVRVDLEAMEQMEAMAVMVGMEMVQATAVMAET